MKVLKQLLFMALVVVAFSLTAMAQQDDNQNRPKKDPPVIVPPVKDPPKDRPKDDNGNRPKKPAFVAALKRKEAEIAFV